ncbi:MAG: thiosulfate oxidation carrier protein SoxY [Gammaproteobacteria bacterium]|nr:MAG: thiosulfate oxidation carrier protein SoxY [Gammaproteobacteria bacterium]
MKRRTFMKGAMTAGTVGIALSAGLLTPSAVLAAWPKSAFDAKSVKDALGDLGMSKGTKSSNIKIKAPDIAENGAVVPVTVTAKMSGVESIALLVVKNPSPLTSSYVMGPNTLGKISTRIKMGKTSAVMAVVKAGGKTYTTSKDVKVTIGGCGG